MSLLFIINFIITQYFHSECIQQFSNNDHLYFNFKSNILLSSSKQFNDSDVNNYDNCDQFFIYNSHNATETLEEFERFLRMHSDKMLPDRKYLFYFNGNQSEMLNELFTSDALKFITNLLVIKEDFDDFNNFDVNNEVFKFYTHKYVGESNHNQKVLLDTWFSGNKSFTNGNDLFPDKMSNQHGRVISVSAGTFLPQTHIEVNILIAYVKMHNATLYLDTSQDHLGEVYNNWTGSGMFKSFMEDKADLVSFALYTHRRRKYGSPANTISILTPTCLVPKPTKRDNWMITHLFRKETWLITLITYFILIIITILFNLVEKQKKRKQKKNMDYLMIIRTAFGQPNKFTKYNHSKMIITPIILTIILIHVFFSSKLAVRLIKPRYLDSIETLQQLADSNIKFYSEYEGVPYYYEQETLEPYKTLYKNFRKLSKDDIGTITDQKFGYIVDVSKHFFYALEPYFTLKRLEKFQLLKEQMMYQYTTLFFRRNSVLVPSFNKLLGNVLAHGLVKFWEFEAIYNANDTQRQKYLRRQFEEVNGYFTQLKIGHIQDLLIFWICGLILGFVVFLFEILSFTKYFIKK